MSRRLLLLTALLAGFASPARADRALVIGLDTYQDASLSFKLKGASGADAERIRGLLTGSLGYKDADIRMLRDGEATRAAILDGLTSWLGEAKPGEKVFFYFAGYGHFVKTGGKSVDTLLPFDAQVKKAGAAPAIGQVVTAADLDGAFAALKGRSITAVIDASHSGTVTRAIAVEANPDGGNPAARTPQLGGLTRSIVVEPAIAAPPPAGAPAAGPAGLDLVTWSAVSPSQTALIDEDDPSAYHGVFTAAFADGIAKGLADHNHNGVVSNQELLDYVRGQSADYCKRHAGRCEMGLTPLLEGDGAPLKVAAAVAVPGAAPGAPPADVPARINEGKVTPDKVLDALGAVVTTDVRLEQFPPSPVKLGATDIHFRITAPRDGFLVLLMVTDDGEVVQLFPNSISAAHAKDGRIRANSPITVPDASYGISFDATSVTKGTVLALVADDPLKLSRGFLTRSIAVIPQDEVNATVLPELAQSLATPVSADPARQNVKPVGRSVATLNYEVIP